MLYNFVRFFIVFVSINLPAYAQLPDFTEMVKENGDAVVNISTTHKAPELRQGGNGSQNLPNDIPPEMEELFKHFFNNPGFGQDLQPRDSKSLGSGFIISDDGYVLTNHHVVNGADEIIVKLKDRRQLVAKLIGSDERTDIALLKVEATNLPVVEIGSPSQLQVGEWVLAIGTPFGFDQSVTAGIVSAKGRSLPGGSYVPFIQTDVAINPGNSGGPLFSMKGKVVGVNSQIYSRSGGYMGLSFSIPIDVAMNVVDQIKTKGSVSRGWLGVQIQDVTRELAESFNMDKPYGALISKVISDSPSEKAGFQIGDVIIEFDGRVVDTSAELPPIVGMTTLDKEVKVKVIREGKEKTVKVVVGLLPVESALVENKKTDKQFNRLGLVVSELTSPQRKQLELPNSGVLVKHVKKGAAFDVGIQQGDVILRVQNNDIRNLNDFDKIVKKLPIGESIAVLIQRRGSPIFLALKIDK
ncbi:MAG: DegQ family serine endoprotease [Methylococcales bacterium]|nr:DegQ family serine endoprotease [Methylococcales bacterium]